jgi:hypothetical protein
MGAGLCRSSDYGYHAVLCLKGETTVIRKSLVLTILWACWLVAVEGRAELLHVGVGKTTITPNPLLPVSGGMGPTAPVKDQRGDLTARAVVLQRGDVRVAIVSLDLLGFPSVLCDRVRAAVPRIAPENILIGATHTHSAPDCYAFPNGQGGHTGDLAYIDFVCRQAAEAINQAIDHLQPATIRVATGKAEGRIAYNYYAPDLYDRRMTVLQAVSADGKPILTLVNFAVHPEVLGNEVGILSPDLVGPFAERVESQTGGMALFMNGAQGGMVTADNRTLDQSSDPIRGYWRDSRTWEECLRIGQLMADEALRIIQAAPRQAEPTLYCTSSDVKLPVDSDILWAVIQQSPLKYPYNPDRTVTVRVHLVNIGNLQVLTIPGEALPNIGFFLKRKMQGEHAMLFGLTNEALGYILTQVDFTSFPRYDYVSRTSLGEMTGEILLRNWLGLIERSPQPDRTK